MVVGKAALGAAVTVALLAGACTGASGPSPSPDNTTASQPSDTPVRIKLVQIAELEQPVSMAMRPDDPALYVTEQSGRVRRVEDGRVTTALDIRDDIHAEGEQGLLGIAFSPDGRYLYLDYTDQNGDTHVTEWRTRADGSVDPGSRRDVLTQEQPYSNHNGGQLAFGPDGYLYIALGDGGSGGDPQGNGQSLDTWLGKILRIDPQGARPYEVPSDNPFVDDPGARPEIWAYGLRNPWRFSFDADTGDLWIADVGQDSWEEINRAPADSGGGENFGWNLREGRHSFTGARPPDAVDPVLEYPLGPGGACSVIGGNVYGGTRMPGLVGHYLYADLCAGWIRAAPVRDEGVGEPQTLATDAVQPTSFGFDNAGEPYLLSLAGPVYRIEPR
ncbi:MAG: sugar dehydrogenase [Propionibacteriales bacterium]|nr:sugar dehydrogenase [Propionibacteriales bacterium]